MLPFDSTFFNINIMDNRKVVMVGPLFAHLLSFLIENRVYMYFIFENFQLQSNQVYCGGLHHHIFSRVICLLERCVVTVSAQAVSLTRNNTYVSYIELSYNYLPRLMHSHSMYIYQICVIKYESENVTSNSQKFNA